MSRVELVSDEQAPLLARPYYAVEGGPSPLTRTLAQVPELLEVTMPFVGRALGETAIDLRTKELVILRVSAVNGCRYCLRVHGQAARQAGLDTDEVAALRRDGAGFGERESALIAYCDALCAAPDPVPHAVMAALRRHFAEHEVVELTLVGCATIMLNRFCSALELV